MPWGVVLTDAVVHATDIRHPLGEPAPLREDAFRGAAAFLTSARWPLTVLFDGTLRQRLGAVRLTVPELGWTRGAGPEVTGAADAVLRLLAGRPVAAGELSGPGAALLHR